MDNEVEKILADIRERVLAEEGKAPSSPSSNGSQYLSRNGEPSAGDASETMRSINSHLTTTARAWDRLPPVISQRSGALARLELWVKGHLKRATRWYAWEQVNFNAAVHHALRDTVQVLSRHEQALADHQQALASQRAELGAQHRAELAQLSRELREVIAHLADEQRVSFKQLSLEATEVAVLDDRARRTAAELLEELQRRIEKLEQRS